MGLRQRLYLLRSLSCAFAELCIGMNVDDIIANSLEFVLDELRLVHVVFAEHESKHWFYIKLCTRDSYSAVASLTQVFHSRHGRGPHRY